MKQTALPPAGEAVIPQELWCKRLSHHRTFRGHNYPAYIIAADPAGRYMLTGSDDAVVKVWCVKTGVLQASCCGHMARPVLLLRMCTGCSCCCTCALDTRVCGLIQAWYAS